MRRKKRHLDTNYHLLEKRQLLAGDVTAFVANDSLNISGDREDNEILVTTNSDGDIEVSGQNGTTVNGQESVIIEIDDAVLNDLRVFLHGGNDAVAIEDIDFRNRVSIRGGTGSDAIGLLRTEIGNDLRIDGDSRGDYISVDTANIIDDLVVIGGGGEDVIGIDNSNIVGKTIVRSGSRSDRVAIRNSTHQSRVQVLTSGGSDFVSADGLTINDVARVHTGGRSDNLFVNNTEFESRVIVQGGGGFDVLEVTGDSAFSQTPRVHSFEGNDVPGGIPQTDAVFSDLIAAGARLGTIVELAAMTPDLSQLVGALQATGLDQALSDGGPFTVFAPLNSAFDAISEVVAGLSIDQLSDVLLFHVTPGEVFAEELVTLDSVSTLLGQSFTVDTTNGVVLNGNATLAATDIRAKDGVIHLLNDVLVPVL